MASTLPEPQPTDSASWQNLAPLGVYHPLTGGSTPGALSTQLRFIQPLGTRSLSILQPSLFLSDPDLDSTLENPSQPFQDSPFFETPPASGQRTAQIGNQLPVPSPQSTASDADLAATPFPTVDTPLAASTPMTTGGVAEAAAPLPAPEAAIGNPSMPDVQRSPLDPTPTPTSPNTTTIPSPAAGTPPATKPTAPNPPASEPAAAVFPEATATSDYSIQRDPLPTAPLTVDLPVGTVGEQPAPAGTPTPHSAEPPPVPSPETTPGIASPDLPPTSPDFRTPTPEITTGRAAAKSAAAPESVDNAPLPVDTAPSGPDGSLQRSPSPDGMTAPESTSPPAASPRSQAAAELAAEPDTGTDTSATSFSSAAVPQSPSGQVSPAIDSPTQTPPPQRPNFLQRLFNRTPQASPTEGSDLFPPDTAVASPESAATPHTSPINPEESPATAATSTSNPPFSGEVTPSVAPAPENPLIQPQIATDSSPAEPPSPTQSLAADRQPTTAQLSSEPPNATVEPTNATIEPTSATVEPQSVADSSLPPPATVEPNAPIQRSVNDAASFSDAVDRASEPESEQREENNAPLTIQAFTDPDPPPATSAAPPPSPAAGTAALPLSQTPDNESASLLPSAKQEVNRSQRTVEAEIITPDATTSPATPSEAIPSDSVAPSDSLSGSASLQRQADLANSTPSVPLPTDVAGRAPLPAATDPRSPQSSATDQPTPTAQPSPSEPAPTTTAPAVPRSLQRQTDDIDDYIDIEPATTPAATPAPENGDTSPSLPSAFSDRLPPPAASSPLTDPSLAAASDTASAAPELESKTPFSNHPEFSSDTSGSAVEMAATEIQRAATDATPPTSPASDLAPPQDRTSPAPPPELPLAPQPAALGSEPIQRSPAADLSQGQNAAASVPSSMPDQTPTPSRSPAVPVVSEDPTKPEITPADSSSSPLESPASEPHAANLAAANLVDSAVAPANAESPPVAPAATESADVTETAPAFPDPVVQRSPAPLAPPSADVLAPGNPTPDTQPGTDAPPSAIAASIPPVPPTEVETGETGTPASPQPPSPPSETPSPDTQLQRQPPADDQSSPAAIASTSTSEPPIPAATRQPDPALPSLEAAPLTAARPEAIAPANLPPANLPPAAAPSPTPNPQPSTSSDRPFQSGDLTIQRSLALPQVLQSLSVVEPLRSPTALIQPEALDTTASDTTSPTTPLQDAPSWVNSALTDSLPRTADDTPDIHFGSNRPNWLQRQALEPEPSALAADTPDQSVVWDSLADLVSHLSPTQPLTNQPAPSSGKPEANSSSKPEAKSRDRQPTVVPASPPAAPFPDLQPLATPAPALQRYPLAEPEPPTNVIQRFATEESPARSETDKEVSANTTDPSISAELLEKLAQLMYQMVRQRLVIERERLGQSGRRFH